MSLLEKPLEQWTEGQLKFEVASKLNNPSYIVMSELEKRKLYYPISREAMMTYLRKVDEYK